MSNKILVTYASRTGSTAEIAEAIGRTLSEDGVEVDVLPMDAVKDLSAYRAIVAGSAIRGARNGCLKQINSCTLTQQR